MKLLRTLSIKTMALTLGLFSSITFAGTITYKVDKQEYEGYYVSPGEDAPLVILLHDWDGLTDYEIQRSDMLMKQGYAVFAADLFGKGVRPIKDQDKKQHTGELYADREKLRNLIKAAVTTAKAQGADVNNAVMAGYCFGGAGVLEYARSGANLKGFVTFHGGLSTPVGQSYKNTKAGILVFHGSADSAISLQDLATLGTELEQNNVPHELISYGGAPHAFTVFGSDRYRPQADKLSWQRFLTYLQETTSK
ncbi:MAG: dienelactone hydrolase family protein [Ketobacter sp.]